MNRIVDYLTIEATDSSQLDAKIRSLIEDGWQPLGGVAVAATIHANTDRKGYTETDRALTFCQAMVKYETHPAFMLAASIAGGTAGAGAIDAGWPKVRNSLVNAAKAAHNVLTEMAHGGVEGLGSARYMLQEALRLAGENVDKPLT